MKFIKKIPPEDLDISKELEDTGWLRLKEPKSSLLAILLSLPISFVLMFVNVLWCYLLSPSFQDFLSNSNELSVEITFGLNSILYLFGMVFCLFLHEMIHAALIPGVIKSSCTYWGLNGLFGFVYTEEVISRNRFFLISIIPLLVLSFLVPLIIYAAGSMTGYLIFLSVFNAGGACVDVLNILLVNHQVPQKASVRSNGNATFYK
ncbi:DUF3267 domain-containing protein [Clostridium sp. E02]|uniref:DUF3267 domain-containing protein n=1 Tax=Clostridium sp. E02 TaxID=2487134 RepID=UPI000F52E743|nr:DUF3267 domain-containing protein [Clostridium sp. E02]